VWAFSRDRILPGASILSKLSKKHRTPDRATILICALAIVVTLLASSERVYATLIASATTTFFITMGLAVLGLFYRLLVRKWQSGAFSLGFLTTPVVFGAVCCIAFEIANSAWPREVAGQPWYVTWAVFNGVSLVAASGAVVWLTVRKRLHQASSLSEVADALHPAHA
jgi:amino acid transporter